MIEFRPRLRKELIYVEKGADGSGGALYDPVVNRRVNLGAISRRIVARLDGTRTAREVIDEVAADAAQERAVVEHTLRTLLLMNLVEGAGRSILRRIELVRLRKVALEPVFLAGSRFACQGSGECCQNYQFGPLSDEDAARIEALDIAAAYPDLADATYFDVKEWTAERRLLYLATAPSPTGDRCVFLRGDRRCGLHAAFGAEAKPGFCRVYPIQQLATVEGLKLYDGGECASFSTSSCSGPLLEEDYPRLRALMPEGPDLDHPIVFLDDQTPCDYGYFLALQRSLVALADGGASAGEALVGMGRLARGFVAAARACPVEHGEPEDTVDRFLAGDVRRHLPASLAPDGEAARAGLAAIARVARALLAATAPGVSEGNRLSRDFAAVLHFIATLASERAGGGAPAGAPLLEQYARAAALPPCGAGFDAPLRTALRQVAFGRKMLVEDRLEAGLLRLAFVHLATVLGARLRAAIDGAPEPALAHLDAAHMLAERVLRRSSSAEVLTAERALAAPVIECAAWLAAAPAG
jgi:Fe-S-cluster containining protein